MKEEHYKGHRITVHSSQQDDSQWAYAGTFIRFGPERGEGKNFTSPAEKRYPTVEESDNAGLQHARNLIDSLLSFG